MSASSTALREIGLKFGFDLGGNAKTVINAVLDACANNPASANLAACKQAALNAAGSWSPKVNSAEILTPGLRAKLADTFGHLALNMHLASVGKMPL